MGFQGVCWDSEKGGNPKILSNKHPPTHPNTKLIALGCFLRVFSCALNLWKRPPRNLIMQNYKFEINFFGRVLFFLSLTSSVLTFALSLPAEHQQEKGETFGYNQISPALRMTSNIDIKSNQRFTHTAKATFKCSTSKNKFQISKYQLTSTKLFASTSENTKTNSNHRITTTVSTVDPANQILIQ